MAKQKKRRGTVKKEPASKGWTSAKGTLEFYSKINELQKQVIETQSTVESLSSRLEDAEIHVNILTRFVTAVCIEKVGMRVGVLKRLLKRVEGEAVRDSQILHLESLYKLSGGREKVVPPKPPAPKDPWEDIS